MMPPIEWIVRKKVVTIFLTILMTVAPWLLPFRTEPDSSPEGVVLQMYSFHLVVDEEKLAERYENGSWNGEKKASFGHSAEVVDGNLWIDGENLGPIARFAASQLPA